jgi:hypothetical protein
MGASWKREERMMVLARWWNPEELQRFVLPENLNKQKQKSTKTTKHKNIKS